MQMIPMLELIAKRCPRQPDRTEEPHLTDARVYCSSLVISNQERIRLQTLAQLWRCGLLVPILLSVLEPRCLGKQIAEAVPKEQNSSHHFQNGRRRAQSCNPKVSEEDDQPTLASL